VDQADEKDRERQARENKPPKSGPVAQDTPRMSAHSARAEVSAETVLASDTVLARGGGSPNINRQTGL
jgi:hypothetical protein